MLGKLASSVQKFSSLFCFRKRRKLLTINPLKQLVGWAEIGGIYKYKFIDFWKVRVKSLPRSMLIVRSKKSAFFDLSLITHFNYPQLFMASWNCSQGSFSAPSHMPITSSMKRL